MADPKMNAKWWKDNKAKTLTDSGDSGLKALEDWDKAKVKGKEQVNIVELETALKLVQTKAEALKGKATKVIHGDTIKYLEKYIQNCKFALEQLKQVQAEGKQLLDNAKNLPKPFLEHLRQVAPQQHAVLDESVEFLKAMTGKKGTADVVKKYIDPRAEKTVNISDDMKKNVIASATRNEWEGPAWAAAVTEVEQMLGDALKSPNTKTAFVRAALLSKIDALKNM